MNPTGLNTQYWSEIAAKDIIGRNALPQDELFQHLQPGARILDLGCGQGFLAESLSIQGYEVTGIDLNQEAIRIGKARKSSVTYLVGDVIQGLSFENETFDAVVLSFVLVNLVPASERRRAIDEIKRVTKSSGFIWINEGTVSDEYAHRYEISFPYLQEERSFFVYNQKNLSKEVQTADQLAFAIAEKKVARIAHHFTDAELRQLFAGFQEIFYHPSTTHSPNSKMLINMSTFVFKKS